MELTGIIIEVLELRSGESARGKWMSQDYVLETAHGNDWKTRMTFSVFGEDRIKRFDIKKGQFVNVSFDIDAREYQGKWYNYIRAFDVRQRVQDEVAPATEQGADDAPSFTPNPEGADPSTLI